MKKLFMILTLMSLSACSSVHRGETKIGFISPEIIASPLEVDVVPGEKVTASEECYSNLFGLFNNEPTKLMYGPELMQNDGNFAPDACTKGALHKAITKTGADIILMPRYSVEGIRFLCLPFTNACLINTQKITVKGVSAKFADIKKMSPQTSEKIKEKLATATENKAVKENNFSFRLPFFM